MRRLSQALGRKEDRLLITGLHTVRDCLCRRCNVVRFPPILLPLSGTNFGRTEPRGHAGRRPAHPAPLQFQVLGWRYEVAYEPSQKYKEGMVILEKGTPEANERRQGRNASRLPAQR